MQGQKPVKLYFFVTFLLILVILIIGLKVNEYLAQKFPKQTIKQQPNPTRSVSELSETFTIVDLAITISLLLVLLFVVLKIIMGKLRNT